MSVAGPMLASELFASTSLPIVARVIGTFLKVLIAVLWYLDSLVRRAVKLWPVSAWNSSRPRLTIVGLCKMLKTLAPS